MRGLSMKLLILEDDPVVSSALEAAILPCWPCETQILSSCSDAIFQLSGPHYIPFFLVDLNLPDGDGLNVLQVAFDRGLLAFTRSVIMTACAQHESVRRARSLGIQHFLVKPVQPAALQMQLAHVLDQEMTSSTESIADILNRVQQLDARSLNDLQIHQIYQLCVFSGHHSLARALTRIRQYLAKPYRKLGELEDALLALQRHCELLIKLSTQARRENA